MENNVNEVGELPTIVLTQEQVEWLDACTKYQFESHRWILDQTTGLVDIVDGSFNCDDQNLSDFKGISFGYVKTWFTCSNNKLTSLKGAPKNVGWGFYCNNNQLTSLEGAPQRFSGDFDCSNNNLINLEGAPESVDRFDCSNNQLTSLKGAPREVSSSFDCSHNLITSLVGGPKTIKDDYEINGNGIRVYHYFDCTHNNLTSLDGAPEKIREGCFLY